MNVHVAQDDYTYQMRGMYIVYQMNVHPCTRSLYKYIYAILT